MIKYLAKKVLIAIVTIFILITLVFLLVRLLPGDPFQDEKVPESIQLKMKEYYGMDKPLYQQYFRYIGNLLKGDLGYSLRTQNRSVNDIIKAAFPYSIDLGIRATIFALIAGLFLGIIAALNHNRTWDYVSMTIAIIGISIPSFIIGNLIQYYLGVKWEILPVAQWRDFKSTIMPTFALGIGTVAMIARLMRTSMLEITNEDYIKTAKAKGLDDVEITLKHQIRNAILPVVTVMGPAIAVLLTGTFVIENIFAIPGLGRHYVYSIQNLDYTLVLGMTIVYSVFLVIMQFIVDILYGIVDPRIKTS